MAEDPAFYKRFSEMRADAIRAFREQRLSDIEYLNRVNQISAAVRDRTDDELPELMRQHDCARPFYGLVREVMHGKAGSADEKEVCARAALRIDQIIERCIENARVRHAA